MTDQYYQHEDDVADTPDTVLANYQAENKALDGLAAKTAQQMDAIEQNLGWLYQQAEQRGDEDAALAVNNAFALSNELAVRVIQFDAVRLSAAAVMRTINAAHQKLAHDYDDLEDALMTGDEDHPLTSDFAEGVREQAWNDMEELAFDAAYDDAHEAVFYDVMMECISRLHDLTGSDDYGAIGRLQNCLLGDEEPTAKQRELLKLLLLSFEMGQPS